MVEEQRDRYISLLTDFGFKRIFGTEPNKHLLMDFLNTILPDYHQIQDLTFKNPERPGNTELDRKAIFDIYCVAENGDRFIVEMQKARQNFFKERSVYYSSFPIQEQGQQGGWNYDLKPVYMVGILNFVFDDHKDEEEFVHVIELKDQECRVFYKKLKFIYIELPKFKKQLDQLEDHFDKWLYLFRHITDLQETPPPLQEKLFEDLFEAAELARLTQDEWYKYQMSLKAQRDWYAIEMTARQEAMEQGFEQGREQGWEQGQEQGREQGRAEQAIALITRQLTRQFRQELPEGVQLRLNALPLNLLEALSELLIDFTTLDDLELWLTEKASE